MKKQFRFTMFLLAAAACLFLLASCGGPSSNSSNNSSQLTGGKRGGSLTYRVTGPVNTLSYFAAKDEPSIVVTLFLMNDRIVAYDHAKQEHVPLLAESYTPEADGRTLDLTLRDGLKFSDGKPLTTADVEFTLKAVYDKRTASPIFRDSLLVGDKEIETKIIDGRKMQ
ncbi:MAG TPA: ABC transporter substrate-binding protein, partial [Pyrinomonadaceae bacterium]|nr:ABC transporter substrate-binding protein [Pyrinomonadaceae bacterium]